MITYAAAKNGITIRTANGTVKKGGTALTLQISDTGDAFNQLNVSIKDTHAKALGIADIDISTQAGAKAAVDKIKAAINTVSDVHGTRRSQNRLDHTINNLSVMTENIRTPSPPSRHRRGRRDDGLHQNNILIQSAQAMLARTKINVKTLIAPSAVASQAQGGQPKITNIVLSAQEG